VNALITAALCRLNRIANRPFLLPLLVFYPTSRCNSRCLSCAWWTHSGEDDLTLTEIEELAGALPALGTRLVLISGGEPLLRPDLFSIARLFRAQGARLWLLTSGLALGRHADQVAACFSRVTISLDAGTPALYRTVRGVDGLEAVEAGVRRLKALAPHLPITARATLHRLNYRDLPHIVDRARAMGLDGISFLAADLTTTAFGRREPPEDGLLRLSPQEVADFRAVVEATLVSHRDAFASGFIAETPEKLRRLPRYYAALAGREAFPPVACNAPWVSVVVEADGTVRPCFFHRPLGNVREQPLVQIVREALPAFWKELDVATNSLCRRCVCSLRIGRKGWRRLTADP